MPISSKALLFALSVSIATVFTARASDAITINLIERTAGQPFDLGGFQIGVNASNAPATTGTGTLANIMQAAANYWSGIIQDTGTLNIQFGWSGLSGSTLGAATQFVSPRDFSGGGRVGIIRFDGDGSSPFYVDDDPTTAENFGPLRVDTQDLGGGEMSVGVSYGMRTGPAAGRFDIFSIALHEIGHLLGLGELNQPTDPNFGGVFNITSGTFAGAALPLTSVGGGHLSPDAFPNALLQPFTNGDRRLASDADIAAIAQISGFSQIDFTANVLEETIDMTPPVAAVPLPATGLMLAFGLGGLLLGASRRTRVSA